MYLSQRLWIHKLFFFFFLPQYEVPDSGIDSKAKTFCMHTVKLSLTKGWQAAPSHCCHACRQLSHCTDPPSKQLDSQQPLHPQWYCAFSAGWEQRGRRKCLAQGWQGIKYFSGLSTFRANLAQENKKLP